MHLRLKFSGQFLGGNYGTQSTDQFPTHHTLWLYQGITKNALRYLQITEENNDKNDD